MSDSRARSERRSWTWWLAFAFVAVPQVFIRTSETDLSSHDRVAIAVFLTTSTLAGVALQLFGPAEDLLNGAAAVAALFIVGALALVILPGDIAISPADAFTPMGFVSGLVLAAWWQRRPARHAGTIEESSVGVPGQ